MDITNLKHQPIFIFFIPTTCSSMYFIIAFGLLLFFTFSETPKMSPASFTKYSKSLFSHLFVNWASLTFSWANSSSKSNNSKEGFGTSLKTGGNTPGANPELETLYQREELRTEEQSGLRLHALLPFFYKRKQLQAQVRSRTWTIWFRTWC